MANPHFTPFTQSTLSNARVAHTPPLPAYPLGLGMVDQLIVKRSIRPAVEAYLKTHFKATVTFLAGVFDGLPGAGDEYDVIQVIYPAGTDIFQLTDAIRTQVAAVSLSPGDVSPNHVLVPATVGGSGCPAGPPRPAETLGRVPPPEGPEQAKITVIDSGYQDWWQESSTGKPQSTIDKWGKSVGPWALANPLADLCTLLPVRLAQYINGTVVHLSPKQLSGLTNAAPSLRGWNDPNSGDLPETAEQGVVDTMAGHANFVAGVIAQYCGNPEIEIWSHNGSFPANADFLPTEASVARSIVASQQSRAADVIHVGFAFPLRDPHQVLLKHGQTSRPVPAGSDSLSGLWKTVFQRIGTKKPVAVVAPVGNEKTGSRHYPAALTSEVVGANILIGVASTGPSLHASAFSNSGTWVTCTAIGEGVESAFFPAGTVQLYDDPKPRPSETFAGPYALWKGTSFSSPKITGRIAANVSAGQDAATAWKTLQSHATHAFPPDHVQLGMRFDF